MGRVHAQIAGRLTGPVTKWIVVVFWLVVVIGLSTFAGKLSSVQNNEMTSWLPDSAESTQAMRIADSFQDPDAIPTTVVYENTDGLTPQQFAQMERHVARFAELEGVVGEVTGPIPSQDGQAAQTLVVFDLGSDGLLKMPEVAKKLRQIAQLPGANVYITGPGGQAATQAEIFEGIDSTLLFTTVIVVILILLLTYRSPVLWLLPVISAAVALVSAQSVIYFLAKHADLTVNAQSQGILTVLVFGAGTDYALLLVARYREELRRHEDRHEAMAFALHRASPAIIASGGTVILGMLCLLLAEVNSTSGLGPVAAVGIAVGLLVMITLLPALLVITGRWVFWPVRPAYGTPEPSASGVWSRLGNHIAKRPRKVWIGTALALAVCTIGIVRLDATGLANEDTYTKQVEAVVGQEVLTRHGLADGSNPLLIVSKAASEADVAPVLDSLKGITDLTPPSPPVVRDGIAFTVVGMHGDPAGREAFDTVRAVRAAVQTVPGAEAKVGGAAALNLDMEQAAQRDNRVVIPAVLVVVLLVLMLLLRALVGPLLLIATVVLSFGASLGISALLFHYVFGFNGTEAVLPLFVFVFLVALGIDYNIFLMTRVREETPQHGTRKASLLALAATGGVITSAGIVLAATFLTLTTLPLVVFAEVGIAVALGVLLDTLVVRSVLVTALNLDIGPPVWWPSRLDREQAQSPGPR